MNVSYKKCSYKYLLLWQLTTGMRIGETLVLDYKNDISLSENKVDIKRTQTKDENGNIIIGETTKTDNGMSTLTMNNISKQILGHKDISVTMKYYIDVDGSFIESETDNAIQYLVDKNIFGVEFPKVDVA